MSSTNDTIASIDACIIYFKHLLHQRLKSHFQQEPFDDLTYYSNTLRDFPSSPIFSLKNIHHLSQPEFILLITALVPHIDCALIDREVSAWEPGGDFLEIGGVRSRNYRGILPTIQTVLFLLAGGDIRKQMKARDLFSPDSQLIRYEVIVIGEAVDDEPFTTCKICLQEEYVNLLLGGSKSNPVAKASFPAIRLTTRCEWDNLVLNEDVKKSINELYGWLQHSYKLHEEFRLFETQSRGYKALFYGPPGTGKTLCATLIGKYVAVDVFRIDLSLLFLEDSVDMQKKMNNLFRQAESKNWILLLEDCDSLLGKRTTTNGPLISYPTAGVAHLMQKIKSFAGIFIFESNSINNIDEAFLQKLNDVIFFPFPTYEERKKLWDLYRPQFIKPDDTLNIDEIAANFGLSGEEIMKASEKIFLTLAKRRDNCLRQEDVLAVLKRRYVTRKEEKPSRLTTSGSLNPSSLRTKNEANVFVCYSSKDRSLRDLIVEGLKGHLHNRGGLHYSFWDDREIDLGADWEGQIQNAIEKCNVSILLVSGYFVSSQFIQQSELGRFLKRRKEGGFLILPVLMRRFNIDDLERVSSLNFFKTYYTEYGFNEPHTRHHLLPFDKLGDDPRTTNKQLSDFYFKLADYIHTAVTRHFEIDIISEK